MIGDHSSMDPVITIPEGAPYKADANKISSWIEGYVLSDDVLIAVNNTVMPKANVECSNKTADITYFFDTECDHRYSDWSAGADDIHTRSKGISPNTGDK